MTESQALQGLQSISILTLPKLPFSQPSTEIGYVMDWTIAFCAFGQASPKHHVKLNTFSLEKRQQLCLCTVLRLFLITYRGTSTMQIF